MDILPSEKIVSIGEALSLLNSRDRVVTAMAASEPVGFFDNLADRASELDGLEVLCANPSKTYPCFEARPDLEGKLSLLVMFLTAKVRGLHGHGRVHYVPQHLSQWARNILAEKPVSCFWGTCSLPDKRGFVSLGLSCCYESEVFRRAKIRVLEINPAMPVTFGATTVPIHMVDRFILNESPLPSIVPAEPDANDQKISTYIDQLVPDGATLQLGIGGIPNAAGKVLMSRKDLGIHTEMINDTMMDLVKSGAVSNFRKTRWPGKVVGSFVYGSRALYDFVDKNPGFELQPSSVINDPYRMGKNYRMVSINTAVEVDITGQVCSESIGHRELSGVGGAFETHIGAQRSEGGVGIIALHSRARSGGAKIVFELKPGAKVSISRNDVDTIVTEYGIARLKGRSVAQRVRALTSIAHPEDREDLLRLARDYSYI